jgi:cell division septation protein DedD
MYEVQVGAFEHQGHAQAMLTQVRDWFPQAYLTPRQGPDGLSSRVRVGPFTDKAAVQRPGAHARRAPRVARRRAGNGLASRRPAAGPR